ncbi:hypothetical protein PV350_04900 [Streptomyces sp. PA03-6a]|nr:hypothetical protein [Streptomyces sp. PA03-6a]
MSQDTGVLVALICAAPVVLGFATFAAWIAVCELYRHWRAVGPWLLVALAIAAVIAAAAYID